jgi:hypothetical protein
VVFRIRIRTDLVGWVRIQLGKNDLQKKKKVKKCFCFEVLDVLF